MEGSREEGLRCTPDATESPESLYFYELICLHTPPYTHTQDDIYIIYIWSFITCSGKIAGKYK